MEIEGSKQASLSQSEKKKLEKIFAKIKKKQYLCKCFRKLAK
jgi:hypothetical protein